MTVSRRRIAEAATGQTADARRPRACSWCLRTRVREARRRQRPHARYEGGWEARQMPSARPAARRSDHAAVTRGRTGLTAPGVSIDRAWPTPSPARCAEPHERLDPEARARREAALKLVRKYGDPVLRRGRWRSTASTTRWSRRCAGWGASCTTRYGIGLAAHAGRRDAPRARLPDRARGLGGGAREPGARVVEQGQGGLRRGLPVAARRQRRGRAARCTSGCARRDERGEPILVEASGLEARVIQHEMDHLDGVLILDRTSRDQRKQAMRALREALEPRPAAGLTRAQRLPRHTDFAARCCARLADSDAPAAARHHAAPTPSRAAGRRLAPPPVGGAGARARDRGDPARAAARARRAASGSRPPSPRCCTTCAYGVLIKEPLLSDYEMINVHPSLLPRWRGAAPIERAIMAGDAETGVAIMRVTAGLGLRRGLRRRDQPIDPTTTTARSPRAWRRSAPTCWSRRSTSARRRRSRTSRASPTRTRSARASARWTRRSRRRQVERTIRALRPHIGSRLPLPDGTFLGVIAPRSTARRSRPPAAASAPTATGCCSTATAARSS